MVANITDKFNKASSGNGNYPTLAKVATARSTGDAILVCEDLTGWATDTAVHFSTYKVDADGAVNPATQTDWKGVVSGDTITNLTRIAGAADTGNAVGDIVELNPTIGWLSDLVDGILASHNQNGSIKAGAVTNTAIADGAVDSAKLGAGAVTNTKLASGAVKSDNVDFTTLKTDGTTSLPSINIADGGKYLVTAGLNFYNSTASQYGQLNVQVEVDGTLVPGTDYIIQIAPHSSLNTYTSASWCVIVDVPANKTVRLAATTQDRITFRKTWMNAVKIG